MTKEELQKGLLDIAHLVGKANQRLANVEIGALPSAESQYVVTELNKITGSLEGILAFMSHHQMKTIGKNQTT